jgi:hypothetical protein
VLVRPLTERSFEIVAGARRFRAAQMAEVSTVPVRIVRLSDAEALEASLSKIFNVETFIQWKRLSTHCISRKGPFRQCTEPGTRADFVFWGDFAKLVSTDEGSL